MLVQVVRQPCQLIILLAGLHMHPTRLRAVELRHVSSLLLPRQLRPWAPHPWRAWLQRLLLSPTRLAHMAYQTMGRRQVGYQPI